MSIPVVTKVTQNGFEYVGSDSDSGGAVRTKVTGTHAFKYNANGQIKSFSNKSKNAYSTVTSNVAFKFNKAGGFTSRTYKNSYGDSHEYEYKLDKKNRVKSIKYEGYSYKYNGKGYVSKVSGANNTFTWNSSGLLTKVANKSRAGEPVTVDYAYDKNGNITSMLRKSYYFVKSTITNTYQSGLLKKRVQAFESTYEDNPSAEDYESVGDPVTTTYSYKTIKVLRKFAAQVKAQQKWIKLQYMNDMGYYDDYCPPLDTMYR